MGASPLFSGHRTYRKRFVVECDEAAMSIQHAQSNEVIDVRPFGESFDRARTTALVKSNSIELIRLVLPVGKSIAEHQVGGEITLQCIEGKVEFNSEGLTREIIGGQLIYLAGNQTHSLRAVEDSSLLLTVLLSR
jgi:quercetin dioxygenase-like cupin family protein